MNAVIIRHLPHPAISSDQPSMPEGKAHHARQTDHRHLLPSASQLQTSLTHPSQNNFMSWIYTFMTTEQGIGYANQVGHNYVPSRKV